MTGFLFWILIVYISIKNSPEKIKSILLISSLLPTTLQQAVTCSADGMINAFSFLFISYFFKIYLEKEKKMNLKYGMILFIGLFIPIVAKITYIFLLLLLFALPSEKFKNKKERILFIICTFFLILTVVIYWQRVSPKYIWEIESQKEYLKSNILYYMELLYRTTRDYIRFYIEGMISSFAWTSNGLPHIINYSYLALIIIHTFSNNIIEKENYKFYFISLISIAAIYLGISTTLYLFWNPENPEYIQGVQGRYFIPILPVLIISLSKKVLIIKKEKLEVNTNLFLNFGLVYIILLMIQRFYVEYTLYIF